MYMKVAEMIVDSLKFPLYDFKAFVFVGIFSIFINLTNFTIFMNFKNWGVDIICGIIALVCAVILFGYFISIIKSTSEDSKIPSFNLKTNLINGIKYYLVFAVFIVVLGVLFTVVNKATGSYDAIMIAFQSFDVLGSMNSNLIPQQYFASLNLSIAINLIITLIFNAFFMVGTLRLAKSGSIIKGIHLGEIFETIINIGGTKFIGFYVSIIIINLIIAAIGGVILFYCTQLNLSSIGILIYAFIFATFISLFDFRMIGLLGRDS